MQLALVTGSCTATIKDASLHGRRLAVVRVADQDGTPVGAHEVALDVTGCTAGQLVLLARGSSARQPSEVRALATDLTVVAIVDEISIGPAAGHSPESGRNRRKRTHG